MMFSLLFLIGSISLPGYAASKEVIRALEGTKIDGQFIVVMNDDESHISARSTQDKITEIIEEEAESITADCHGVLKQVFSNAIHGFTVKLDADGLQRALDDPRVETVEEDGLMQINQVGSWGLDRIDDEDLPLDKSYAPTFGNGGEGVTAYIIDTGILASHVEFEGRATQEFNSAGGTNTDCNGHGTHVAGTVGAKTYGVAPKVKLVGVKVLSCTGGGSYSGVIAGIDWVMTNAKKPATANMSLGGGKSATVNAAVKKLVASGVTTVVAAGNNNGNACDKSPASELSAITVGSTTDQDARSVFSNWGSCVDVFAPGSSITAPWIGNNAATKTISGTSMASPHVCGGVALYLGKDPSLSPNDVADMLLKESLADKITDVRPGSPNQFLYVGSSQAPTTPTTSSPTGSPTVTPAPTYVWGVNSADYIYYRNGKNGSWTNIGGRLKQVSVSCGGSHVWGVNGADNIFYRAGKDGKWVLIGGKLKWVSVSCDGSHVWGVNSADSIFYRNGKNGSWTHIGGRLKQVEVSHDGSHVWGVNSADFIFYRNGKNGSWTNIAGILKQVSVSCDGSHVWGVNSSDYIYYRNGKNGSWTQIGGRLKNVSVSCDGSHVWGVNSSDYIYYRNGKNGSWTNIEGRLKQVSGGGSTKAPTKSPTKPPSALPSAAPTASENICEDVGKSACKKLKESCVFGKSKIPGACAPKKSKYMHDCSEHTDETSCSVDDNHDGLCKFDNGVCVHICDDLSKKDCVKVKNASDNKKTCKAAKIKNPCKGCMPKTKCA